MKAADTRIAVGAVALVASLLACATRAPTPPPPPRQTAPSPPTPERSPTPARVESAQIPLQTSGGELLLEATVFWPVDARQDQPRPTIVFSHGSPMTAAARARMTPLQYSWAVQWFVARGYVVLAAMRRGFGASQGSFSEGLDGEHHDYGRAGRVAAVDIRAALSFAASRPGIDPARIVLAGHSAGGFGSLALASEGVPVRGVINFAGGKGAQLLGAGPPYTTAIASAAGEYGRTSRVPSLWIYAANDKWFSPSIATAMFDAYVGGGAPAEMLRLPAIGEDGHSLFTAEAVNLWSVAAEEFLRRIGMRATLTSSP